MPKRKGGIRDTAAGKGKSSYGLFKKAWAEVKEVDDDQDLKKSNLAMLMLLKSGKATFDVLNRFENMRGVEECEAIAGICRNFSEEDFARLATLHSASSHHPKSKSSVELNNNFTQENAVNYLKNLNNNGKNLHFSLCRNVNRLHQRIAMAEKIEHLSDDDTNNLIVKVLHSWGGKSDASKTLRQELESQDLDLSTKRKRIADFMRDQPVPHNRTGLAVKNAIADMQPRADIEMQDTVAIKPNQG